MNGVTNYSTGKINNKYAAPYDFSFSTVLSECWARVKGAKATYWKALAIFIVINIGLTVVSSLLSHIVTVVLGQTAGGLIKSVGYIVTWLVSIPLVVGFSYLSLRRASHLEIHWKQIFEMFRFYWPLVAVEILILLSVYIIAFLGACLVALLHNAYAIDGVVSGWPNILSSCLIILTILVSVYFSFVFMFGPLLIVNERMGVMQSMKTSFAAVNQHWFKIIALYFIMAFIYLISAIPLLIGLIWTVPMFFNLIGVLYRYAFGVAK